jgi:vancomycin resistance protein YoaR
MTGKLKVGVAIALGVAIVLSVGGTLWANRPFQMELGSYRTSLADRTEAQRHNIRQAVLALNGVVIEPGQTFSFNETVGPRTPERGYRNAPAFMERDLVTSVGGGICQVSSTVYNAAALSGLSIIERHPHFRRVASVPPGRDATVWYGMADFRFLNRNAFPVRLFLTEGSEGLYSAVYGKAECVQETQLRTSLVDPSRYRASAVRTVRTTIFSGLPAIQEVISLDTYQYP